MSDTELKIGDNATVTLVFSEAVCGASSGCSLSQTGGTDFSSADITSSQWVAQQHNELQPVPMTTEPSGPEPSRRTDDREDDSNTLSLANNSYTDPAGNNGPAEIKLQTMRLILGSLL